MLDSYTPELLIIDLSSTFFYFIYLFVPRVLIVYALFIDRFIHGLVDVKKSYFLRKPGNQIFEYCIELFTSLFPQSW